MSEETEVKTEVDALTEVCDEEQEQTGLNIEDGTESEVIKDNVPQDDSEYDEMLRLMSQVKEIAAEQNGAMNKISSEVREIHKLYHNEFAGRLRNMQEELEKYHEIDRGRVYDDILREVARIYCDNEGLLTLDTDEKTKKHIKYMFMDLEQLLDANGVMIQRSSPGDKRNNKFCQIVERVETSDPTKHDTVVRSKGTGFYTEKRPLIKEMVDVYVYQATDVNTEYEEE